MTDLLRRAFAINSATAALNIAVQLATTLAIARLLSPSEVGQFSVGAAFCALAVAFREIGVGLYLLKERELTQAKINAAATVLVISSGLLGLALFSSAQQVSTFFGDDTIQEVVALLAINFAFVPWLAISSARTQRRLEYGALAINSLLSAALGSGISIWLASRGLGALSLAWGLVATNAGSLALFFLVRPSDFKWRPTTLGLGKVLEFSAKIATGSFAQQATSSAPDLFIGKLGGVEDAGLFSRATALKNLVAQHLTTVAYNTLLPKLAEESRDNSVSPSAIMLRNRIVLGLLLPVYACTASLAEPLVRVLFGVQWMAIVPVAQALCITPMLALPFFFPKVILTAAGEAGSVAQIELGVLAARVIALAIGTQFGIFIVACLLCLEAIVYIAIVGTRFRQLHKLSITDVLTGCRTEFAIALSCGAVALLAQASVESLMATESETLPSALTSLALGGTLSTLTWLTLLWKTKHPLKHELAAFMNKLAVRISKK